MTSNKFKLGLPNLPIIILSEFIANNMDKNAGESSALLKICPNILHRNQLTLVDNGVTLHRAYNALLEI